jgi:arsenate reductase
MAEEILRLMAGDRFEVESAGLEPGGILPAAVEVMRDYGIDLSAKKTRSVFDLYKAGRLFQYVITVCDESQTERCPIFPSALERLHWSFEDPSRFEGTREEVLARVRGLRDRLRARIADWVREKMGEKPVERLPRGGGRAAGDRHPDDLTMN